MDGDSEEYGLVLAFDTDEPEFTRGFEAGQLWERIERDGMADQLIHAENAEMIMRIAEAKGLDFRAEQAAEGWLHVVLVPQPVR
jgi:hypothetical protein